MTNIIITNYLMDTSTQWCCVNNTDVKGIGHSSFRYTCNIFHDS